MSEHSASKPCPKCKALIPANAPQGLCPKCLLEGVANPTDAGTVPIHPADLPTIDEIKAAFPDLEILEMIGRGGMGCVFKARQPKLERLVALKVLSASKDAAFGERFAREGRLLARLNHPNIVSVHDFGQAGGFFYLLMEYVDGVNLRQAMQAGRFTPVQALGVVPKVCEALQFAHDEGVLHRDIKPENILLDTRGRIKIADFGIAMMVGDAPREGRLTQTGYAIGTPNYMAPEQIEHPSEVDHRADIYSLGVVFYELLTGELPLGRFERPSRKTPMDVDVDEIVLRALAKERERRQQSARELGSDVETVSRQRVPPRVGGEVKAGPTVNPWPRRIFWLILVLLTLPIFLIGLALMYPMMESPLERKDRPRALSVPASDQIVAVPVEDGLIASLPEGSLTLLAVSWHPSEGQPWWRPDGRVIPELAYENPGSQSGAGKGERAYEFVFRSRDLPAGASRPAWRFEPAANWAGGGRPLVGSRRLEGHHLVSVTLPRGRQQVQVWAGVATQPWETITEQRASSEGVTTAGYKGHNWTIGFIKAVETREGNTVLTVSHNVEDWQVRVVAVGREGTEIEATGQDSNTGHLVLTFGDRLMADIETFRFQARPYKWMMFDRVMLAPVER